MIRRHVSEVDLLKQENAKLSRVVADQRDELVRLKAEREQLFSILDQYDELCWPVCHGSVQFHRTLLQLRLKVPFREIIDIPPQPTEPSFETRLVVAPGG